MASLGGFFKGLGKGALKFGGLAAAPFTGGASLLPGLIGTGLNVAGGIAQGRAAGRGAEAGANRDQDLLRLQGENLNLRAPGMRAGNAVRGDMLAGWQPPQFTGSGRDLQLTGGFAGLTPSDDTRALGKRMSRDALLSQMEGPAFTPTPLPQAGLLDKILTGAGYAGLGLDAARSAGVTGGQRITAPRPIVPPQNIPRLPGQRDPWKGVMF